MLNKFNSFMEKWMPFVTPVCLMVGVLFPDIARHGVPYVTYVFAFMTFIGALKSRFRDIANVFKRPLPLILMFLVFTEQIGRQRFFPPMVWVFCFFRKILIILPELYWSFRFLLQ